MSRQLTVIATDSDLADLEQALQRRGDVDFLSDNVGKDGNLLPLGSIVLQAATAGRQSLFCFLAPRHLERKIVTEVLSPVKMEVDEQTSNVIDFWRPYFDGHILRPGRMYFQNRLLRAGVWIPKDPDFCKWADSVLTTAKRVFKRASGSRDYFGMDAEARLARKEIEIVV